MKHLFIFFVFSLSLTFISACNSDNTQKPTSTELASVSTPATAVPMQPICPTQTLSGKVFQGDAQKRVIWYASFDNKECIQSLDRGERSAEGPISSVTRGEPQVDKVYKPNLYTPIPISDGKGNVGEWIYIRSDLAEQIKSSTSPIWIQAAGYPLGQEEYLYIASDFTTEEELKESGLPLHDDMVIKKLHGMI